MDIKSYKDLIVWQKGIELALIVYKITEKFPKIETYGLTQQMRKAVVSVPSNIAEGKAGGTRKEYRHFLFMALGSGAELETQIEIAKQLSFGKELNFKKAEGLLEECMKMLNTLIKNLKPIT
ncbi:MAG: four helix bundle protein [Candidatus Aadella gelida]|nr:four helix bundle protein [Candidatus Aadella gelida]